MEANNTNHNNTANNNSQAKSLFVTTKYLSLTSTDEDDNEDIGGKPKFFLDTSVERDERKSLEGFNTDNPDGVSLVNNSNSDNSSTKSGATLQDVEVSSFKKKKKTKTFRGSSSSFKNDDVNNKARGSADKNKCKSLSKVSKAVKERRFTVAYISGSNKLDLKSSKKAEESTLVHFTLI